MTGTEILTQIVQILVGGISGIASGIGSGLSTLATSIFLQGSGTTSDPTTLSTFGVLVIVFAGVGLAIGLCRTVVRMITTMGGHKA